MTNVAVIYYNDAWNEFTSTATLHDGQKSTILALNNAFYHWGALIRGFRAA